MYAQGQTARTVRLAILFELGLGAAALVVGWLLGHWPAMGIDLTGAHLGYQLQAIGWGLAGTLPLLIVFVLLEQLPLAALRRIRDLVHRVIQEMFAGASVLQLGVIALAAGVGEELLFRGLIQAGMSRLIAGPTGVVVGLTVAAVLFGACHWLDNTYGVLAILAGAYFGGLLLATGSLWTPLVAHAAYDFLALIYLVRPNHLVRSSIVEPWPSAGAAPLPDDSTPELPL
jgi:hypothetical protein